MPALLAAPATAGPEAIPGESFTELYRSSRDDVFAYVSGLLRDRSAAEDVTAAAFERAFRRASSFDPARGSMRAWLFGIARNAALDELRRRKRLAELHDEHGAGEADTDDAADAALRRATLRAAIARLTGRERELVALKFFAGLTVPEIATVIGVSERATAMRVHRTIEKLRRACNEAA